ncbi:phosphoglycerate kinase [Lampropedia cohaerens]|uniref:Phosphoglycerate kinase n=1 Tax=Lampropedia cohaerens TaxID=1610491 RepID=A0A0U1PZZ5_9BURK|nr:histidine phosphatase family protein [Lampropedia cohaerens]KKW68079.1 phosphoglycerate kinase [Lampropedia cohaerens]
MANLYLVRHGQASLGAADYDCLSPTGQRQAERLGAYWRAHGLTFDAIYSGTLRRHAQTLTAMARGSRSDWAQRARRWPALDEYDAEALLKAAHLAQPRPLDAQTRRAHFAALCKALAMWIDGRITPAGMPEWTCFQATLLRALEQLRTTHQGQNVLLLSSGGPISTLVAATLAAPAHAMIGLNMQLRNSAVSEIVLGPRRSTLRSFNTLPHLAEVEAQALVTAA